MRFDDSLTTVLASDAASGFGAAATWRQLVDLVGRGRVEPDAVTVGRLRDLRGAVPVPVRAASARALAFARPPTALVALFAEEELGVAAPVLRTATLAAGDWLVLLPGLTPAGRSVLRHRRDLPPEVVRGLESFGSVDFVIAQAPAAELPTPLPVPPADAPSPPAVHPASPAVSRQADAPPEPVPASAGGFVIADLVARIDAFQRQRPEPAEPAADPDLFRFETDRVGTLCRVDGGSRPALIGVSLAHTAPQGLAQVDGVAAGAFRARSEFSDARLVIAGSGSSAGAWRLAATPCFDAASGRFTGYRGVARRPRADEAAEPSDPRRTAADTLRQLVHELRTPANAIAGFAELIETQLLGPVASPYRERARLIGEQTAALLVAIEDLDLAARLEAHALDLRPAVVMLEPLLARLLADLVPLARLREASIIFSPGGEHTVLADDRAAERLLGRLLAALLSLCVAGERLKLRVKAKADGSVAVQIDRPAALAALPEDGLLGIDPASGAGGEGAPLLGAAFALRLARNLAAELGGTLAIGAERLTLRLPAALTPEVGQAAR